MKQAACSWCAAALCLAAAACSEQAAEVERFGSEGVASPFGEGSGGAQAGMDEPLRIDLEDVAPGASAPEAVVDLPWGSGEQEAGGRDGDEAMSRGPMSFDVDAGGGIHLLDQENSRVLLFGPEGSYLGSVPLPRGVFEDILAAPGGRHLLLDRLLRASVIVVERDGTVSGEHGIVGPGVPEGGGVTAMLPEPDGVWLEYRHGWCVHLLDEHLAACPRTVLRGRGFEGGARVIAELDGRRGARLRLEKEGMVLGAAGVSFDHDLSRIVWVEPGADGRLLVFFHLMELDGNDPGVPVYEATAGVSFDGDLDAASVLTSPYTITERAQFKEFDVSAAGDVYQMAFDDDGVSILRWGRP